MNFEFLDVTWKSYSSFQNLPPSAVFCYHSHINNRGNIFLGRASHNNNKVPVNVIPSKRKAKYIFNDAHVDFHNFEVFSKIFQLNVTKI